MKQKRFSEEQIIAILREHEAGVSTFRAAIPDASRAIVLVGVKGRLRLFAHDAGLRATPALSVSGRGGHVPPSFDLAPCSGRSRTWEHSLLRRGRAGVRPGGACA